MRVEGIAPTRLEGIALDTGMRLVWQGKTPKRSKGYFKLVPLGSRYATLSGDACVHGYRFFIRKCLERGAPLVETAIREYRSLDDLNRENVHLVLRDVVSRYGERQHCVCTDEEDW